MTPQRLTGADGTAGLTGVVDDGQAEGVRPPGPVMALRTADEQPSTH